MQNHQLVIAPRCLELNGVGVISEIVPALCCVDGFIHLVSMGCEAVPKMLVSQGLRMIDTDGYGFYATDVAIQILQLIAEEFLFCSNCVLLGQTFARCSTVHSYPLGYTPKQGEFLPSYPICKLLNSSTKDTKSRTFTLHNLVFLVLMQQSFHPVSLQRQSQDYDFFRQTIVIHSGWFGSILEFLYGLLPRPPDVLYVFSPKPTILMVVQVQDASPFHLEGEY
ncbi:unnamed protein product [Arabidopsis lyrata]|nr:unnamed protein product [Arabidopsis lyrata]